MGGADGDGGDKDNFSDGGYNQLKNTYILVYV